MSESEGHLNDTVGQVVRLLLRRRWWILGAAFLTPLATVGVMLQLPDQYKSEATIIAEQQQVSARYVDPVNNMTAPEEVTTMTRMVMSRNRLLGVIDSFGLYPREKARMNPDQLAERMREDIAVDPLDVELGRRGATYSAFKLSFTAENPRLAQTVASRLTALFIEESLKTQNNQASGTTRFLSAQLAAAKQRLEEQEQRLSDFKRRNLGALPEQTGANLDVLKELRLELQTNMNDRGKVEQQRVSLEAILDVDLASLQADRSQLLKQYTPKHPEVLKRDGEIEKIQALMTELKTGKPGAPRMDVSLSPDEPRVVQLRSMVEAYWADSKGLAKDEQRLRAEIDQVQARLRLTPLLEEQFAALLRDYELYKRDYADLQDKQVHSQLTADLEGQQEGQHFLLIDAPTLPGVPSGPKRVRMSLWAVAVGVAIGVVLAFLMDMWNRRFYNEQEVKRQLGAPLIVGIPLLRTSSEERRRKWRLAFEWLAGCTMTLAVVVAEVFVFLRDGWV